MNIIDGTFVFIFAHYVNQVLAAYVKSIEDHGYILHFGVSSFTGFLPKDSSTGKMKSTALSFIYILVWHDLTKFNMCFSFLMQKALVVK